MRPLLIISSLIALTSLHFAAFAQNIVAGNEKLYTYGDGAQAFVLKQEVIDGKSYDATLQMNETNEIWILEKSQGSRGDVVYRNDTGRIFLRVNHIGGATLYPTPESMGIPVLRQSEYRFESKNVRTGEAAEPLVSIDDWSRAYAYAGNKKRNKDKSDQDISEHKKILFSDWPHSKSAFKNDLILHLSDLMENHIGQGVERIIVKIGEQPAAVHDNADLTIWVNPTLGFAGRPSTEKILSHLKEGDG